MVWNKHLVRSSLVFPGGASGKELTCQCRKHKTQVRSLGVEDPLEEGMATHSSLAWRVPWTEEPGGLQSTRSQRVRHDQVTKHRRNLLLELTFLECLLSKCICTYYLIYPLTTRDRGTVDPLCLPVLHLWIQPQTKSIQKISESSKQESLNLPCPGNYLHSTYIV